MINDAPLINGSDSELSLAVEENVFALFRAMASLPGGEIEESEKLSRHNSPPTSPLFKGAWRTHLSSDEADDAIDETIAWFKTRRAPFILWWMGAQTRGADLRDRLTARGFTENLASSPGMASDLRALNEETSAPHNFTIARAVGRKELRDWRDVFCKVYEAPASAGQAWVDATSSAGFDRAPWQMYVGYLKGKPVATNLIFDGAGVAGVYAVGTVSEARGKGIGAAITTGPLVEARERGYRFGVLYSSDMGCAVYRRLGFREVDCKITRYLAVAEKLIR
jgi:ribosomal protein S18 acetylase RimI-like enzyme